MILAIILLALAIGILVHTRMLLHQARARIAALESELAASYRQLDAQRAELDEVTSGAQFASATALGIIQCVRYLSDAFYEIHQIKPGINIAKWQAITGTIRHRLEDRVQSVGDDLQIIMVDGAFSIEPAIVNQLESFKDSLQHRLDTAARYIPPPVPKRGKKNDDQYIKQIIEGWMIAEAKGIKQIAYCKQHSLAPRTFRRFREIYRDRRLDLLNSG